jgi:hypothetical protein
VREGDRVVTAGQYRLQPGTHVDATAPEQAAGAAQ